jgi:hypothetical protein
VTDLVEKLVAIQARYQVMHQRKATQWAGANRYAVFAPADGQVTRWKQVSDAMLHREAKDECRRMIARDIINELGLSEEN